MGSTKAKVSKTHKQAPAITHTRQQLTWKPVLTTTALTPPRPPIPLLLLPLDRLRCLAIRWQKPERMPGKHLPRWQLTGRRLYGPSGAFVARVARRRTIDFTGARVPGPPSARRWPASTAAPPADLTPSTPSYTPGRRNDTNTSAVVASPKAPSPPSKTFQDGKLPMGACGSSAASLRQGVGDRGINAAPPATGARAWNAIPLSQGIN